MAGGRHRPGNYLVWTWGAQCGINSFHHRHSRTECVALGAAALPQPDGARSTPGGPTQFRVQGAGFLDALRNFGITDVPSNLDYAFRAGIFPATTTTSRSASRRTAMTYRAYAHLTDARNGRSSGGPAGWRADPRSRLAAARNPVCEQSDSFIDIFDARNAGSGGSAGNITPFLVTLCPGDDTDDDDDD